jgi:ATP-binding cassette subfamily B protein
MFKKKFPFFLQLDSVDCGPACLKMISKFYGKDLPTDYIRNLAPLSREGITIEELGDTAETLGFNTHLTKIGLQTLLTEAPLPCVVFWREEHFVVVYEARENNIKVADPEVGLVKFNNQEFLKGWTSSNNNSTTLSGYALLLEPDSRFYNVTDEGENYTERSFLKFFLSLKKYKPYLIQLIIGLGVSGLIQLFFPFATQAIVDYGIKLQNLNFIALILVAQVVLVISQNTVEILRSWLIFHLGSRINITLISNFLIKLLRLPVVFFEERTPGDVFQRLNDNHRIELFLSTESLNMIFSSFSFFAFSVVLFFYSPVIALIFVLGTAIYILWILLFMKKREVFDKLWFVEASRNNNFIMQIILGIQEIRLNNSEQRRRWNWEDARARLFHASSQYLKVSLRQASGARILNDLKNITITFVAARAAVNGEITLGMMISIQYILGQLNGPLSNMIIFFQSYQQAKISYNRFSEITGMDDENKSDTPRLKDVIFDNDDIQLKDISFKYRGRETNFVLNDVSFTIPSGKITAIVGASGGGKTSLLKLLVKFYEPTSGIIKIGDRDYRNIDNNVWRDNIGVVMQDGFIFSDTIEQNISESGSKFKINSEKLARAIEIANLSDLINGLPLGIKTRIGANEMQLSGGEKQRVLIARAVYKDPKFLFFDEATSSLDTNNEKTIVENLNHFFKNRTVLIIAHRLSTIKNADQIIVMEKGRIQEAGNHENLLLKRGSYFKLIENQLSDNGKAK